MEHREDRFGKGGNSTEVKITKRLTSFAPDYNDLDNIPTINGTEVKGDLTSEDIKVLSENPDDYESETLEESEGYITIVNENGEPTKIPISEVKAIDEKADEAIIEAKKAGTKFIGTKVEDGELVIVTADWLDAEFTINKWGHLEVKLGDSNASQVTGRVVGGMFYSGVADVSEDIIAEIEATGKIPLDMDVYLCTDTGHLWQYQFGEFVVIMTLSSSELDGSKFASQITGEIEGDNLTLNLLNNAGEALSSVVLPYVTEESVETVINERFDDKEVNDTYQQVDVNKDGIVISGNNVWERWEEGQTESDTLGIGGFAFVEIKK